MASTVRDIARDITPPVIWRFARKIRQQNEAHRAELDRGPKPIAEDPFMYVLRSIVPGWMNQGDVELFDYCFANLPSGAPVIEIGSFAGLSLNTIIHLLRSHGRSNPVFSVDPWALILLKDYRDLVIEIFRLTVSRFSRDNLPYHIVSTSDRFFADWTAGNSKTDFFSREVVLGGPISFAYIDGAHSGEQPHKDFQNVDRHLEVGGFVVFDDSSGEDKRWYECFRAASKAAKRSDYRLVDKRPNYCIQKIA